MDKIQDINYGTQKIEKHFSNFLDGAFRLTKRKVDRKHFGNWAVVLQSDHCIMKFIQDRGTISVLIAPPWASGEPFNLEHFFDVDLLLDFRNDNRAVVLATRQSLYDVDKILADANKALHENFQELIDLLNSKDFLQTESKIKEFHLQRLKRMYPDMK